MKNRAGDRHSVALAVCGVQTPFFLFHKIPVATEESEIRTNIISCTTKGLQSAGEPHAGEERVDVDADDLDGCAVVGVQSDRDGSAGADRGIVALRRRAVRPRRSPMTTPPERVVWASCAWG